ncbi:hypoxanthine phosphoribosyltransferase [Sporobacter termitidis DSM 10068]|uniref:Hypoxanthine phosphoribosyltransferase n=1 Tax=Sporobacter termitidis DSM 10068 TaxID=1123282 RepID=A0A1M5Y703_9FIRM|nr:hypoxanthine phosphoribosyltransferase [Sporobacter termitidis]SHI07588.1 hypoxanthine phosphoribosyltransferase [Sporobacter termitidis DSM 10068]
MKNDIEKVYYSEEMIQNRVRELGQELKTEYAGKKPLLVGVLKGSFIFLADLARALDIHCEIEFIAVSSYGNGTETSGEVKMTKAIGDVIRDRHVIVVEDILDTGLTLDYLKKYLLSMNPASLKICTFLDKPSRRKVQISADYVGFECIDAFYVGYGLDYAGEYRNLPYIGSLKPAIYS